ncbi:pyridoxamine 5'-phosphate oxidase family protein [Lacinutrix sp. Bg11-31]|uniref:pyridoxamine 5'-phosphate oxidase family protein n=1 Tax=Lacinutrix sp. Bg11-31 TaxID=2057808 RepID=UPI000C301974|nr:pyridoxamine 5'-phosphate oxidase family protein [Lacinutrix sp. Bg11-31]AUC81139.1 flavin mononucleotide-binding protein [Lacinutrix sp. Bg11-31]
MIKTLDTKEKIFILSRNYIGYLAYIYNNEPFVVPITYFYDEERNSIICYSADGHKLNALRKNNATSICITDIDSVNDWKSILIRGTFNLHYGSEAKAMLHQFSLGVKDIILKTENRDLDFISQFSSKIFNDNIPSVFTITVEEITGRMRKF